MATQAFADAAGAGVAAGAGDGVVAAGAADFLAKVPVQHLTEAAPGHLPDKKPVEQVYSLALSH